MRKTRPTIIATVTLIGAVSLTLFLFDGADLIRPISAQSSNRSQTTNRAAGESASPLDPSSGLMAAPSDRSEIVETFEIVKRLFLAVLLSGILAFRPRKNVPLFRRSLFVSQSQILLAVVAAALMMIVSDNAARAFAIFAAASLVRFRTNIGDPKEITVLLISLALGLAAGFGRWDLGIALCVFSLALLWLLEFNESEQKFRSMELTVKTRSPEKTQDVLRKIFRRMKIDAEVRQLVPTDDDTPVGSITYYLNLPLKRTTDEMSDRVLSSDTNNIEGIQWSKTKNASDIYQ